MARIRRTPEQRQAAIDLANQVGCAEAARRTGIPEGTIASWRSRSGIATLQAERTRTALEVQVLTLAERRTRLAADLLDDVERLRSQLFAPAVERKVIASGDIVDVRLPEPSFSDKKALMVSIAVAVDKVLLLSGEATSRHETIGDRPQAEERLAKIIDLKRAS